MSRLRSLWNFLGGISDVRERLTTLWWLSLGVAGVAIVAWVFGVRHAGVLGTLLLILAGVLLVVGLIGACRRRGLAGAEFLRPANA